MIASLVQSITFHFRVSQPVCMAITVQIPDAAANTTSNSMPLLTACTCVGTNDDPLLIRLTKSDVQVMHAGYRIPRSGAGSELRGLGTENTWCHVKQSLDVAASQS